MLFKIKKVKTEEETVELKLPAYFKTDYYAILINEESVLEVTHRAEGGHLVLCTKSTTGLYQSKIAEYIGHTPITATEFYFFLDKALQQFQSQISKPVTS